jgi:hypothetical protein
VDDADDVRLSQLHLPQRSGSVLDCVECHRNRDAVFRLRVGRPDQAQG